MAAGVRFTPQESAHAFLGFSNMATGSYELQRAVANLCRLLPQADAGFKSGDLALLLYSLKEMSYIPEMDTLYAYAANVIQNYTGPLLVKDVAMAMYGLKSQESSESSRLLLSVLTQKVVDMPPHWKFYGRSLGMAMLGLQFQTSR